MMIYQWVVFDADDTLFRFDAFQGLKLTFSRFGVDFTAADYDAYEAINQPLWVDYQHNLITAAQLKQARFQAWANRLQVSTDEINHAFLATRSEIGEPMQGAEVLLAALHGNAKLGIITNGFSEFQQSRLERAGFHNYFEWVVTSEEVGAAKPHPIIFEHAFSKMNYPERHRVLMVGDNPESDIVGGWRAGFDTCWLNVHHRPLPAGIQPTYQVSDLTELAHLLCLATGDNATSSSGDTRCAV
jgi:YjjG family noncanonical pyrimidine nucleotidase